MSQEQLILECYEQEKIADAIRIKFEDELRKIIRSKTGFYTFRARSKGAKPLFDKVRRLNEPSEPEKKPVSPKEISDAWACRYVTLFQQDIFDVFSDFVNYIGIRKIRNQDIDIVEVIIYDNRPESDPLSIGRRIKKLCDQITHSSIKLRPERLAKDTGYSSVHIILKASVTINLPGHAATNTTGLFEVQIRDIFEEAWSEISHKLYYGVRPGESKDGEPADLSDSRSRLNALKTVVDGCSQLATLIGPVSDKYRKLASEARSSSITNLEDDFLMVKAALPAQFVHGTDLLENIEYGYRLLQEAHEAPNENLDKSFSDPFYKQASDFFAKALNNIDRMGDIPIQFTKVGEDRPIKYFLKIEMANAATFYLPLSGRKFTDDHTEYFNRATAAYTELREEFKEDPFVHYRFGQALIRRSLDNAEVIKAIELLERADQLAKSNKIFPKNHWVFPSIYAEISRGKYKLYKSCRPTNGSEECLPLLTDAIEYNRKAYTILANDPLPEIVDEKLRIFHRTVSNNIFYTYLLAGEDSPKIDRSFYNAEQKTEVKMLLAQLNSPPLQSYAQRYIESIDNLVIGAYITDNMPLAMEKAYEVVSSFISVAKDEGKPIGSLSDLLPEDQRVMFGRAQNVLMEGWSGNALTASPNGASLFGRILDRFTFPAR